MNTKPLVIGAVSGAVSAVLVDLHAWSEKDVPFSWKKAFKRWAAGAASGAAAAAGLGQF